MELACLIVEAAASITSAICDLQKATIIKRLSNWLFVSPSWAFQTFHSALSKPNASPSRFYTRALERLARLSSVSRCKQLDVAVSMRRAIFVCGGSCVGCVWVFIVVLALEKKVSFSMARAADRGVIARWAGQRRSS